VASQKHESSLTGFNINYNSISERFRKGSVLVREEASIYMTNRVVEPYRTCFQIPQQICRWLVEQLPLYCSDMNTFGRPIKFWKYPRESRFALLLCPSVIIQRTLLEYCGTPPVFGWNRKERAQLTKPGEQRLGPKKRKTKVDRPR